MAKFFREPISKKKIDFWIIISEASVCGQLAPLVYEAEHHGRWSLWPRRVLGGREGK